jgi:hypothetical protein
MWSLRKRTPLAPPGHADALGRAIAGLSLDPTGGRRLARQRGGHVAEHFAAERLVRDVEAIYDALLRPTWVTL